MPPRRNAPELSVGWSLVATCLPLARPVLLLCIGPLLLEAPAQANCPGKTLYHF
jgi:hypothetical protein